MTQQALILRICFYSFLRKRLTQLVATLSNTTHQIYPCLEDLVQYITLRMHRQSNWAEYQMI